jgi:CheY-like chemotaxis protein
MPKILLVEDDNNLREIFDMRLQAEGYQTVSAGDGEEALVVAVKEKPDLIIADVMMPKLSGFEMLETLRSSPDVGKVKVIMMTALGQAEDRARGEKLGVVKYLVKSQVTLEDFVRVVREVLPIEGVSAEAASSPPESPAGEAENNNKQESEQAMPPAEDNQAPSSDPAAPDTGVPAVNPISEPAADSAAGGGAQGGAQTTAQEESSVENQINDFVSSTPSVAPAEPAADSGAGTDAAAPAEGSDVPASPAPVDPAAPAGDLSAPAAEENESPTPPAPAV